MKFKDLLRLDQEQMFPNAIRIRKNVEKRKGRNLRLILSCSAAAVLLVAASIGVWLGFAPSEMAEEEIMIVTGTVNVIDSIVPTVQSDLGVGVDTQFVIETSESISEDEMRARIAILPKTPFEIDEISDCRYEISFEEGLEANKLYKLSAMYNGTVVHRWAFQTEDVFKVTNFFPSDNDVLPIENAIEFTFSHRQVTGVEEAFKISPAVKGRFEQYGRTWAFIPESPLEHSTYYTITLDSSVKGPGDVTLEEDSHITFRTNDGDRYLNLIFKQNEYADTFLTDEAPIAALSYNGIDASSAKVRVYALKDADAYISAHKKYVKCGAISNGIAELAKTPALEFEAQPVLISDYEYYGNAAFINYPSALEAGYYFAEIEMDGLKVYQMLQSTTVSVYTLATNGDYVIWANDAQSGKPLNNIEVKLDGFEEVKTNQNGVASFYNAETEAEQRFLVVEDERPYVVALNGTKADKATDMGVAYHSYLTTNSDLYRSGDTVGVFGAIIPRMAGADLPDSLTLSCELLDEKIEIEPESDGTFQYEMEIPETALSGGLIVLEADGVWLNSASVTIADYHLPQYVVSVSSDRTVYNVGDTVKMTAQVTYMDGTPASGVSLSGSDDFSGVTDHHGRVSFETIASVDYGYNYSVNYPESHYFECRVDEGEVSGVTGSAEYLVLDSPYALEVDYKDGQLSVNANYILENVAELISADEVSDYAYDMDALKGDPVTASVWVDLHEVTYTKEISGSTYDPINKTVNYTWKYNENDSVLRSFEMNCENGVGTIEIPERTDREKQYYAVVGLDGEEGYTSVEVYFSQGFENQYLSESYRVITDQYVYDIGETARLSVCNDGQPLAELGGQGLYTVVCGGVMELYSSDQPTFELEFKKEYAPDVCVYGAYFDGKHVYSLGYECLEYDVDRARLSVEMEADREEYRPGDEVELTFKVTDADGNPIKATLNVSVLDRALYLMNEGVDDPIHSLMASQCFMSIVYETTSHYEYGTNEPGLGEGGGGGELEARTDFEDAPCFETIRTDGDGIAELTFTLPDTLTEWKVITKAVTSDAQGGCEVFELLSTQDFFVSAAVGDLLKTTDDCTVAVKCDGVELGFGEACQVTAKLVDGSSKTVQTLEADVSKAEYGYLNFGKLEVGNYSLVVSGKADGFSDEIVLSLEVVETASSVWITEQQSLDKELKFNLTPSKGGVTLTVVDEELAFWHEAMGRLKSSVGNRPDQVLGQYLAEQFYENGAWMGEGLDYSLLDEYQCYDGIAFRSGGQESDLILSAKMAAVVPEFCNREWLADGFYYYVGNRESARVDVLTAYFGLAALGEPVLLDIQALYANETDLTYEEYAYMALAFAYAGDFDTAQYIFETELENMIVQENGGCYVAVDGVADEELTSHVALLCNHLSAEYGEGFVRYIADHDSEKYLLNLELIAYLNGRVIETVGENKVEILINGEAEEYSYFKQKPLVVQLTAEQASSFSIRSIEGKSKVSYSYYGAVSDLQKTAQGTLVGMERKPSRIECDAVDTFSIEVPSSEQFEDKTLNFTVPAGLRLVEVRITGKNMTYVHEDRYHTGSVSVWLPEDECQVEVVVRGALPGEYLFEPFIILNSEGDQYLKTVESVIIVTE